MSNFRATESGAPMRHIHNTANTAGERWVVYETHRGDVRAMPGTEWTACAPSDLATWFEARLAIEQARERAADVAAHGVPCGDRAVAVRVTKTRIMFDGLMAVRRSDGRMPGDGRMYAPRLTLDAIAAIEARASGRERVDFIAEGKAANADRDTKLAAIEIAVAEREPS